MFSRPGAGPAPPSGPVLGDAAGTTSARKPVPAAATARSASSGKGFPERSSREQALQRRDPLAGLAVPLLGDAALLPLSRKQPVQCGLQPRRVGTNQLVGT